jgi:hypothetical protein
MKYQENMNEATAVLKRCVAQIEGEWIGIQESIWPALPILCFKSKRGFEINTAINPNSVVACAENFLVRSLQTVVIQREPLPRVNLNNNRALRNVAKQLAALLKQVQELIGENPEESADVSS